jgi:hypothetical protein
LAERATPADWRWLAAERDGEALEAPVRLLFASEPVRFALGIATAEARFVVRGDTAGAIAWTRTE